MRLPDFLSLSLIAALAGGCKDKGPAPDSEAAGDPPGAEERCGFGLDVSPNTPVATIGGEPVLCSELIEHSGGALAAMESEFHIQARRLHEQALVDVINDRLLQSKARAAGLSLDKFIASEVVVAAVSDAEMQSFYDQAVAAGEALPPMEEIQDELRSFLNEQKQKNAMVEYQTRLRQESNVETHLPMLLPPRTAVEAKGYSMGPEDAPVTIVQFSDYQCAYCRNAEPVVRKLLKDYGDKLRLVHRDFPLENHPQAFKAAEAGLCAGEQGKFWEMHDDLFRNQDALEVEDLKSYAGKLGLDQEKFDACLDSGRTQSEVLASMNAGARAGVSGTPAFFINGRIITGSESYERFQEVIDHELERRPVWRPSQNNELQGGQGAMKELGGPSD